MYAMLRGVYGKALIAAVLSLVVSGSVALAQEHRSSRSGDRSRAVVLFERSEVLYKEGNFAQAAVLLQQAYELEQEPILLYNLGRALESDGQLQQASEAFERYLATAKLNPSERKALQARVASLKEQYETNERIKKERDEAQQRQKEAENRLLEQSQKPSAVEDSSMGPWPWVILGVGAAGLATGTVLAVMASSKHKEAEDEPIQQKALELQESANNLSTASAVFLVAGGVVAAGGLTWVLIEVLGNDDEPESVALGITPTSVWLSGRF
jgi:tetratricopeptide (TPR) repeat protein